jgi:hypothetical protein
MRFETALLCRDENHVNAKPAKTFKLTRWAQPQSCYLVMHWRSSLLTMILD